MRLPAYTVLAGIFLPSLAAMAAPPQAVDAKARQDVLAVDARYRSAMMEHDHATLAQILTDDFRWVGDHAEVSDKSGLLNAVNRWRIPVYERNDVALEGDASMVILTAHTTKGVNHARSVEIFKKTVAGWRLAFLQNTAEPN